MTTNDFITELFYRVAEPLVQVDRKHSQGKLYPSEIVTLALLYTLKGVGQRAFWRWLVRDYRPLSPHLLLCWLLQPSRRGCSSSIPYESMTPMSDGAAKNSSAWTRYTLKARNRRVRLGTWGYRTPAEVYFGDYDRTTLI